jgi:peroxiredoxin
LLISNTIANMFRTSTRLIFALLALILISDVREVASQEVLPNTPPVLLQMIRDDAVQNELTLTVAQRTEVKSALKSVDGRWFQSRILPAEKQQPELAMLTSQLRAELDSILDAKQRERLTQLERQALGTRMLTRDDVARALKLTPAKQQAFNEAFIETDQRAGDLQQQVQKGELPAAEAQEQVAKLKQAEQNQLLEKLSTAQRAQLGPLTGQPFDFSKIRRTLPLAPELTDKGVTWIQGGPLKLADLQGKVVAVHYYAFQCINCRRNLPHYKAWHDDYADKGLVIIGIQTPETSSERKLNLVAAAAKSEGIEYPIMLDSDGANWDTWSNRMWPTVYLIDKQGYIRRWWTGEMNWQGTEGEQQMRKTIEQLLVEETPQ